MCVPISVLANGNKLAYHTGASDLDGCIPAGACSKTEGSPRSQLSAAARFWPWRGGGREHGAASPAPCFCLASPQVDDDTQLQHNITVATFLNPWA